MKNRKHILLSLLFCLILALGITTSISFADAPEAQDTTGAADTGSITMGTGENADVIEAVHIGEIGDIEYMDKTEDVRDKIAAASPSVTEENGYFKGSECNILELTNIEISEAGDVTAKTEWPGTGDVLDPTKEYYAHIRLKFEGHEDINPHTGPGTEIETPVITYGNDNIPLPNRGDMGNCIAEENGAWTITSYVNNKQDIDIYIPLRYETYFVVKKTDGTDPLEGATFGLSHITKGGIEAMATSDENGNAVFKNIPEGTYRLYEETAPFGYVKSNKEYQVTVGIDNDGKPVFYVTESEAVAGNAPESFENGETIATFVNEKAQMITIELPITKKVVQGGSVAPGETTFTFELLIRDGEDEDAKPIYQVIDTADLSIKGAAKDGINVTLEFEIPETLIGEGGAFADGIYLREEQNAGEGWVYSDKVYYVERSVSGILTTRAVAEPEYVFFDDSNQSQNPEELSSAIFENTYTNDNAGGDNNGNDNNGNDNNGGNDNDNDGNVNDNDGNAEDPTGGSDNTNGENQNGQSENADVDNSVQTGDNNTIVWLLMILAISFFGIVATLIYSRRKSLF